MEGKVSREAEVAVVATAVAAPSVGQRAVARRVGV